MQPEEQRDSATCAACGHVLEGKFCSQCGEKVWRAEDKTVKHFFEEVFHLLTHADSKFLKSLKYLVTKPGFLTKEYIAGRRKAYASPLSMFLIGNLIYVSLPHRCTQFALQYPGLRATLFSADRTAGSA